MSSIPPSDQREQEEYSLPERRRKWIVRSSRMGVWHVVEARTFKSNMDPGRWVRRAADQAALCGSMRVCVVGVDAATWPTERTPLDMSHVTCARCRKSYESWERRVAAEGEGDA